MKNSPRILIAALAATMIGVGTGSLHATDTQPAATEPTTQPAATRPRPIKVDEDVTLNFLKTNEPEVYNDALLLKARDPKKYADFLKDLMSEIKGLLDLQRKDLPIFTLVMEDRHVAYKALQISKDLREKTLSPAETESKTTELTSLVTQQFMIRQKIRITKLDELQRRLDDMRHELDDREKNRDSLISQRVSDLLKKTPKVEW